MKLSVRSYVAEFVGTFTLVFVGTAVATLQGFLNQGPTGFAHLQRQENHVSTLS